MLRVYQKSVINPILWWAKRHPAIEVTGLVSRHPKEGDRVIPMRNVAQDPARYYEWDPKDMAREWGMMQDMGEEPIIFYHSHPGGRPTPSERDMEGALFVGVYHLIVYPHGQSGEWCWQAYECIEEGVLVGAKLEVVV